MTAGDLSPADIPVVILCGGMGTRLREASEKLPKPLVDIGGRPILWHIMKTYSEHGFRRFVLALGYKSDLIKQYFLDYRHLTSDFTLHLGADGAESEPVFHGTAAKEDWEITFVETGLTTATAARIRRVAQHLDADRFALTYGDGIGDVDITGACGTTSSRGCSGRSPACTRPAATARCGSRATRSSSSTRSRPWPTAGSTAGSSCSSASSSRSTSTTTRR